MLDDNFPTANNTPFECHCFRKMAPNFGETADQFVARLRRQAQHCDFTDVEDQIRDQLVEKIGPVQLRRKLPETSNIKLHDALKLASAWEAGSRRPAVTADRPVIVCRECGWTRTCTVETPEPEQTRSLAA